MYVYIFVFRDITVTQKHINQKNKIIKHQSLHNQQNNHSLPCCSCLISSLIRSGKSNIWYNYIEQLLSHIHFVWRRKIVSIHFTNNNVCKLFKISSILLLICVIFCFVCFECLLLCAGIWWWWWCHQSLNNWFLIHISFEYCCG